MSHSGNELTELATVADILKPNQFNERFTVYLNAEGAPVQRTLREMTGDAVLTAIDWHNAEAERSNARPSHSRRLPS